MFVVFDLDGTLADISHRLHFIQGGKRDWDSFFKACVDDVEVTNVIEALCAHSFAGHKVEIWSARSDVVRDETKQWLDSIGISPELLVHMRAEGDTTPDVELKRSWLHALAPDERPNVVYDDRQSVVDMWREEGVSCFQVTANWEADKNKIVWGENPPELNLLIGPSGAGKTTFADFAGKDTVLSSDDMRIRLTGGIKDQSRNDDVFYAMRKLALANLECGISVVIDATNLRRRDRMAFVKNVPAGVSINYILIDRPLAHKVADGGWRNDVIMHDGKSLIESHHERFKSCVKHALQGDGIPSINVHDYREAA